MDSAITPENVIIPTKGELVLLLWQSLLETYADRGYNTIPSLSLSSIDCSPLPDLCRSVFNVVSFPTINLYRDGQLVSTLRENVFVDVLLVLGKARYNAWKNITETPPTPPTSLQSYTVTISPPPSHSQDWNPSLHHNFTFPQFKNFSESLNLKITHTPLTTLPRLLSTSKTPIILFFGASFCPHTLVFNEPWLSLQTALVTNPLHSPPSHSLKLNARIPRRSVGITWGTMGSRLLSCFTVVCTFRS
ncbi:hypothetical protein BCR33DRAFT_268068 [Rhizoclosmatium globosum]|uniref:Thioredoxin domain-containing protein n=1 Tax=Rhizoclosmatium globosum TaxID=329046 RepID=A0A1Y2C9K4_9FUNG|nr:hypothetical protein BCR33DRAFT_268068 [Rhizoclosmatium globosum]|eukprot:ORY42995.1 hypothetical protein BCR33DRAFT_268068 [Rhizoclosmatium globosum]